jgi:hypothetical protein
VAWLDKATNRRTKPNHSAKETNMLTLKKSLAVASLAVAAATSLGFTTTASADEHFRPGYVHVDSRGWHGDRYYDGHRYWERREWERHHAPRNYGPPHRYY